MILNYQTDNFQSSLCKYGNTEVSEKFSTLNSDISKTVGVESSHLVRMFFQIFFLKLKLDFSALLKLLLKWRQKTTIPRSQHYFKLRKILRL